MPIILCVVVPIIWWVTVLYVATVQVLSPCFVATVMLCDCIAFAYNLVVWIFPFLLNFWWNRVRLMLLLF